MEKQSMSTDAKEPKCLQKFSNDRSAYTDQARRSTPDLVPTTLVASSLFTGHWLRVFQTGLTVFCSSHYSQLMGFQNKIAWKINSEPKPRSPHSLTFLPHNSGTLQNKLLGFTAVKAQHRLGLHVQIDANSALLCRLGLSVGDEQAVASLKEQSDGCNTATVRTTAYLTRMPRQESLYSHMYMRYGHVHRAPGDCEDPKGYEQRIAAPRVCGREIFSASSQVRSAVQSFKLEPTYEGLHAHVNSKASAYRDGQQHRPPSESAGSSKATNSSALRANAQRNLQVSIDGSNTHTEIRAHAYAHGRVGNTRH